MHINVRSGTTAKFGDKIEKSAGRAATVEIKYFIHSTDLFKSIISV